MSTSQSAKQSANPDNACAANGVTADGRPYHYSAAHNGYVFDEPAELAASGVYDPQAGTEAPEPYAGYADYV